MELIVNTSRNWAIGRRGSLLFSLPEDMKYFREKTLHKTVLMGRRTLESFPGGRPLVNRTNIVLSADPAFRRDDIVLCRSPREAAEAVSSLPPDEVMLIGGETIYRMFLPCCSLAYVTRVEQDIPDADSFFPDLDHLSGWELTECSPKKTQNGLDFRFCVYVNHQVQPMTSIV